MVAAAPVFTRERIDRTAGPVPLAFVFDDSPVQPEHIVTVVSWSLAALPLLRDLHKHFASLAPREGLPVEALRGRLEVTDADNLRLDRGLGLWGRSPAILWTACATELARERVSSAVLGWLVNDVEVDEAAATDLVQRLKHLARAGQVVEVARRTAQVFCWEQTRSGTATGARTNREGYADLADFVVRQLEGKELLPGLGGLRRIASGRLDSNQAELITEPVLDQAASFSVVVRVRVLSFPGRATPVVALELSRRVWTRAFKRTAARELSAFALPDGTHTALRFTLKRRRETGDSGTTFAYHPDSDFPPIARAFGLPLDLAGDTIAADGHRLQDCRLLVVHKHGVGKRVVVKQGIPDLDKLTAFRQMEALLAPVGLRPWQGLLELSSATRSIKDRNQKWRDRDADEDRRKAFQRWQGEAKAAIASCYADAHHMIIAYHSSCYDDARRAQALLGEMLDSHVQVQLVPIPPGVHGPRAKLPSPASKTPRNRDFAEQRTRDWLPFVTEVRRYECNMNASIDGVLVIAPEWYAPGSAHDDPVNKRAGRITLARELRVPVQYLRPEREDGQEFRKNQDPAERFETRLMMAWLDLAWKNIGRIKSQELADVAALIYRPTCADDHPVVSPPDRVLAIGILRRNSTRLNNESSFVPFGIELDVERGRCSARFARERGSSFEITPLMPLPEVLAELAASGPIQLVTNKAARQDQLQERSQRFFHEIATEFCQSAERPLLLIDAVSCRGAWPWVADTKLDGENILVAGHPHAEADWGNVRIVRVRTDNGPKILFDRYYKGICAETSEVVCYDAPTWAEAQLFKLADTQASVYFSFGSLLQKRVRGTSCYREIDGLSKTRGKSKAYARKRMGIYKDAWATPNAVEFTVAKTARGESPDQLVQFVEWLRTLYAHIGDWTTKPAPLFFDGVLKDYLADYDLDEDVDTGEEVDG